MKATNNRTVKTTANTGWLHPALTVLFLTDIGTTNVLIRHVCIRTVMKGTPLVYALYMYWVVFLIVSMLNERHHLMLGNSIAE